MFGLASYDGKRVYFSNIINGHYKDKSLNIIEASIMDNIYFWFIKNRNPLFIMGEINKQMVDP